ncbi:Uncharacterised protein [Vibrio cholerae]|nr:Uncharacterised protein [Vibrio cholerae]
MTISTNKALPFGSLKLRRSLPFKSGFIGCITMAGCASLIQK